MEIEKQCCTLEQAKKLKELGVKQESYFAYSWAGSDKQKKDSRNRQEYFTTFHNAASMMSPERTAWGWGIIACAFTVAELGKMLPPYLEQGTALVTWFLDDTKTVRVDWFEELGHGKYYLSKEPDTESKTEAEARAAMLIHLLESKTITATEVNERK